jgi:hypothetical protein
MDNKSVDSSLKVILITIGIGVSCQHKLDFKVVNLSNSCSIKILHN